MDERRRCATYLARLTRKVLVACIAPREQKVRAEVVALPSRDEYVAPCEQKVRAEVTLPSRDEYGLGYGQSRRRRAFSGKIPYVSASAPSISWKNSP